MRSTTIPTGIEGPVFNKEIYQKSGLFVWRNAIEKDLIKKMQLLWNNYYSELVANGGRTVDNANFVNFSDGLPKGLSDFWANDAVKEIGKAIHGENVALYNSRIVMKDKHSDHQVFLHQDYCYHLGFPNKCSLFIPLFKCGKEEGSLTFYLGTHQYGFLGDAGEIDPSKFRDWPQITPEVNIGDVVIMNSCLWHTSGPNTTDVDRVMFDIIIQPADDPSGTALINGKWDTDFWIDRSEKGFDISSLFINSRIKKLKKVSA